MKKIWLMIMGILFAGLISLKSETISTAKSLPRESLDVATFAGGCFWCLQPSYDKLPGVIKTVVGYTGGTKKNPTYEEVSSGITGHLESIQITFDPRIISYNKLLDMYWRNVDPTQADGQFVDVGTQYHTAIFYHTTNQKKEAELSKESLNQSGRFKNPIVTRILPAMTFYPAEEHHQKYYKKCPLPYQAYHEGSGRDNFFKRVWGSGQ